MGRNGLLVDMHPGGDHRPAVPFVCGFIQVEPKGIDDSGVGRIDADPSKPPAKGGIHAAQSAIVGPEPGVPTIV